MVLVTIFSVGTQSHQVGESRRCLSHQQLHMVMMCAELVRHTRSQATLQQYPERSSSHHTQLATWLSENAFYSWSFQSIHWEQLWECDSHLLHQWCLGNYSLWQKTAQLLPFRQHLATKWTSPADDSLLCPHRQIPWHSLSHRDSPYSCVLTSTRSTSQRLYLLCPVSTSCAYVVQYLKAYILTRVCRSIWIWQWQRGVSSLLPRSVEWCCTIYDFILFITFGVDTFVQVQLSGSCSTFPSASNLLATFTFLNMLR